MLCRTRMNVAYRDTALGVNPNEQVVYTRSFVEKQYNFVLKKAAMHALLPVSDGNPFTVARDTLCLARSSDWVTQ